MRYVQRQTRGTGSLSNLPWGRPRQAGSAPAGWWPPRMGLGTTPASADEGHDAKLQRLEVILFLAREPLTSRKLSQHARLADGTEARTLIRELNQQYDASGRCFRVEEVAGGYRLLTRRKFAPWLRRWGQVPQETRLSAPALETLAVVAYRQPALRADIEAIRGVNCGEILRQLMDRDLVRISGRSEELGRPYLYSTTKHFLELFGLRSLEQLPRAEAIRIAEAALAERTSVAPSQHVDREQGMKEEPEVSARLTAPWIADDILEPETTAVPMADPAAALDDDDDIDYGDDEEDEDDDDDYDDEDDDDDDEEFDDDDDEEEFDEELDEELDEEEELDEADDDFEDEDWEEVDDEEYDDELDEEDDDDWDDEEEEEDDDEEWE